MTHEADKLGTRWDKLRVDSYVWEETLHNTPNPFKFS